MHIPVLYEVFTVNICPDGMKTSSVRLHSAFGDLDAPIRTIEEGKVEAATWSGSLAFYT